MADDTGDTLDLEDPNDIDVRFMAAYRTWYMAVLAAHQVSEENNLVTILCAAPRQAGMGDGTGRDMSGFGRGGLPHRSRCHLLRAGPNGPGRRAQQLGLLAGLHLSDDEATTAAEAVRWRPVDALPPAADPTYTKHLQGLSIRETTTVLAKLFLHTSRVLTGKAEKMVRRLLPEQREQDQPLIDQATRMLTEHPELVEIEQRAQGYRHLTVVHGEIEDPSTRSASSRPPEQCCRCSPAPRPRTTSAAAPTGWCWWWDDCGSTAQS